MPNQRAKNKIHLGGFVTRKLDREIKGMARREKMRDNVFGFVTKLILEAITLRLANGGKKARRA
jgi:hypothetical protein